MKAGECSVVGAIYNIESGEVKWLGQHPKQAELAQDSKE